MEVLLSVSRMVAGTLERDAVLRSAIDAAAGAMNAEACSILLWDAERGDLRFHIVQGDHADKLNAAHVAVSDESIAGSVAKHQEPVLVADAYEDARFDRGYDARTGFRTRSIVCVPLNAKGRRIGVMQILNRRDGKPFDQGDLDLASAAGCLIALAIYTSEEHEARLGAERLATVGQTIAGLAHCIKNILNGLQGGSYLIEQNLPAGKLDAVANAWQVVRRNMGLLSNIVLDMLSYSKARKPVFQPCVLEELCGEVIELLTEQANGKRVTLSRRTGTGPGEVPIDESAIKRCLINLVGNAIDACEAEKGRVVIETGLAETAGRFSVWVRDNGCGIEPRALERIFDPFYSTKGNKGTGLGLAVTKKIVEEHRGTLRVTSTPGEGTEFTIELPLEQEGASP